MKPKARNILIAILLTALIVTVYIVRRNSTMRGVECTVAEMGIRTVMDVNDADSLLLHLFPQLTQSDIKKLNKSRIRKALLEHPYVADASVGITMGGKLKVAITPEIPVLRLFFQDNEFYLSRSGRCMPLCHNHYCHILVGSVECPSPVLRHPEKIDLADTSNHSQPVHIDRMWRLANYLYDHPKYGDIFDQISVDPSGDMRLTPKLGDYTVIVGDELRLDDKFESLWAFLEQGMSQVGWDTYSAIDLRYRGQVVCTKRSKK